MKGGCACGPGSEAFGSRLYAHWVSYPPPSVTRNWAWPINALDAWPPLAQGEARGGTEWGVVASDQ